MNPKFVATLLFLFALVTAFYWYGSSMYNAGQNSERADWQGRELIGKDQHIKLLNEQSSKQKATQAAQINAERKAAAKTASTLRKKLKLKNLVQIYVEKNDVVDCFNVDGLRVINEILSGTTNDP